MKEKHYIIKGNSSTEEYELDIDEFCLMRGDIESDILTQHFNKDKKFLSLKMEHNLNKIEELNGYVLKELQEMFVCLNIHIYDNPILLENYPHGVHTEGLLLIPSYQYKEMLKKEEMSELYEYKNNKAHLFFYSYLTKMLENIYNVKYSNEFEFKSDIVFDSHENLMKTIKKIYKENYQIEYINKTKTSKEYIDNILFSIEKINDSSSPWNIFKEKIQYHHLNNKKKLSISEKSYIVLNELKKEQEKIVKFYENKQKNISEIVNSLKEKWLSLFFELPQNHIKNNTMFALNDLCETVGKEISISKNEFFEAVVKMIASHDLFFKGGLEDFVIAFYGYSHARHDIEIISQEEMEIREELVNLIKSKNVDGLKLILNKDIKVGFEKKELLQEALNQNNLEVMKLVNEKYVNKDKDFFNRIYNNMFFVGKHYSTEGTIYLYNQQEWNDKQDEDFINYFVEKCDIEHIKKIIKNNKIENINKNYGWLFNIAFNLKKDMWIKQETFNYFKEEIKNKETNKILNDSLENTLVYLTKNKKFAEINFLINQGVIRDKAWNQLLKSDLNIKDAIEEVNRLFSLKELNDSLQNDLKQNEVISGIKRKI